MAGDLQGKRILVIEDEYFIAADLKRALAEQGAIVIGPAGDLQQGVALVNNEQIDAAVLDVNLEGAKSYPIAEQLARQSVPYLLLTGYDCWSLPEDYKTVPRLPKPFQMNAVLEAVSGLLGKRGET